MSKALGKYIYFLNLILILGVSYLYANSADFTNTTYSDTNQVESTNAFEHTSNHAVVYSNVLDGNHVLNFQIAELRDVENEESSLKDNTCFHGFSLAQFNAKLFSNLSFNLHKETQANYTYFDKSSAKLLIRLQVFII